MDGKALTVLNPGSLVEIFSDYGFLKHKKIRISYRQSRSKFPNDWSKTKYEKKNWKWPG